MPPSEYSMICMAPEEMRIDENASLAPLADQWNHRLPCLVVVDAANRYLGIIGVKDKLRFSEQAAASPKMRETTAGAWCNRNASVIESDCLHSEKTLALALEKHRQNPHIYYFPVVSPGGAFLGVMNRMAQEGGDIWWRKVADGDLWSAPWGSTEAKWRGTIWPRIASWLPCEVMLELGVGRGRWSRYLIPLAKKYIALDPDEECVAYCRSRFAANGNARFFANNGLSFPMVESGSCDFVFSVDSLYHCDAGALAANIRECLRVMRPPTGERRSIAFLHHSIESHTGVSAEKAADWIGEAGGTPLLQEEVNWRTSNLVRCFTVFTNAPVSGHAFRRIVNETMMLEANSIRDRLSPYIALPV